MNSFLSDIEYQEIYQTLASSDRGQAFLNTFAAKHNSVETKNLQTSCNKLSDFAYSVAQDFDSESFSENHGVASTEIVGPADTPATTANKPSPESAQDADVDTDSAPLDLDSVVVDSSSELVFDGEEISEQRVDNSAISLAAMGEAPDEESDLADISQLDELEDIQSDDSVQFDLPDATEAAADTEMSDIMTEIAEVDTIANSIEPTSPSLQETNAEDGLNQELDALKSRMLELEAKIATR